jgi:hypothetical protein
MIAELVLMLSVVGLTDPAVPDLLPTEPFQSTKYGLKTRVPTAWTIAEHDRDDRVFVAIIPQPEFDRPGIVACELALAPESLEDYRTRIDSNASRGGRPSGKLASNRLIKDPRGDRLETIWEFHPNSGGFWREVSVRTIANRQLYTLILNAEDSVYAKVRPSFDALVVATTYTPPDTGADLVAKRTNCWIQREYKFAIDLPAGWSPVLAPSEVALLFANGPAHGVWSDNLLVVAHPPRPEDLEELAKQFPEDLRKEDPTCEILGCKVVPQGKGQALETVVRTSRGPFSMTVIERRFRGSRFNYEVKYTVESKRFDELAPKFRQSFESFREAPGNAPAAGPNKAT